jgi:hypothetical protein
MSHRIAFLMALALGIGCGDDQQSVDVDVGCISLQGLLGQGQGLPALSGSGLGGLAGCEGSVAQDTSADRSVPTDLCVDLCSHFASCGFSGSGCVDECNAAGTTCRAAFACLETATCESISDGSACADERSACQL